MRRSPKKEDENMRTVALIPIRAGSKGIKNKNMKSMLGKPLCFWVIEAALNSSVDEVVVSTESQEYADKVLSHFPKVTIHERSDKMARDGSQLEPVMLEVAKIVKMDAMVLLQATNPMTTYKDINNAMGLLAAGQYDSLLSVTPFSGFLWSKDGPVNYDPSKRQNRQDIGAEYRLENGSIYITKIDALKKYKCRLGGRVVQYMMDEETAIEIDEPHEWSMVEATLARRK